MVLFSRKKIPWLSEQFQKKIILPVLNALSAENPQSHMIMRRCLTMFEEMHGSVKEARDGAQQLHLDMQSDKKPLNSSMELVGLMFEFGLDSRLTEPKPMQAVLLQNVHPPEKKVLREKQQEGSVEI